MFKYLWVVVVFALYMWWVVKAIQGLIEEIKFAKKRHRRFDFDNCSDATVWFAFIHAIAILAWSITEFAFYYWVK